MIQSVLSGKYAEVDDIIHRLALTAFLLHDSEPQNPPLDLVIVTLETHREYKSLEDRESIDTTPTTLQQINASLHMLRTSYEQVKGFAFNEAPLPNNHVVHVALGSNVGDRMDMIERACKSMEAQNLKVVRTSSLYETTPMYMEDQAPFINGVCQIETSLDPSKLLEQLKFIEKDLGRQKTVENGPRPIDLDILLYDDEKVNLEDLTIPHPRISEREFVLKPLCDLIPNSRPPSARLIPTFRDRLEALPKPHPPLSPLIPLSSSVDPLRSESPSRRTQLMAVLNLTPDSFSDGGLYPTEVSALIPYLESLVSAGVTFLDIGGQSSRPNAPDVSPEEEIARVLPTIKHIRSQSSFDKLVLSIDTYRASVAAAAIEAGANVVNDVSAGTLDAEMLPLVAKLGCTVVLMHMRGTPSTMNRMTSYPTGIVEGVGQELVQRVAAAEAAGIRRWRMILDPGIGFAKNQAQNLELLRRFGELRAYEGLKGIPWVVGASRKGFIGKITGVSEPSERVMGTAATVSTAIQGGADIVRVHDVNEMAQVTKMADAIWRA
ncbi:origin recognition complex subunit [Physcia stellaris]|nr:origin recognition complex subunit [Physcia stellaris]